VGVISGLASGVEVLNTQLVSTIFSSGKNFNEAGIFGTGENILITDVVNDVQFIKNGNLTIKGAGLIGTMFTRIILSNYNSVVLAADYTLNTNETIKGGALFSNCSSGDVGIEKTYIVTPKIIDLALTDNNNCSFTSDPSNLIVSGTAKLSSSEPNPSTPIWTWRESVILTDRLSEVPVWLTNCIQTPIGTTGIDTLIGFCVGDREIIPTDGSFTVDFPAFITHFSELLALSFSPTVVEGGYLNLGSSFNLEGLANFFITNGVDGNSPFRLNLTGNTAELKLPESNMPFFLGRFQNSTITNTKLFKKSSTTVDSSRWLTTHPDFASSGGVSLIFDEFIYSTFQGEINFDINYVMNNLIWTHTSLFGYLLQGSTFNVNIKGDFVVTNEAQPASSPLLIFSGFYKGEGGANYVINSNSLNLDLTVLTPFCSDPSMGISGSWGFNISDGSPTISSSTYSGTSALRVYCRDDNPPILNLCSIPSIDVAEALNCQASRAP
jgi:hypothetical protein